MSSFLLLTIMALTWGVGGILVKKGFKKLSPWQTYALDAVIIALPMWFLYGFWQSGKLLPPTPFAIFSALLISFVYALYYYAIYHGPIGLATPIIASYPIFTVILSFFLLDERLNLISYIGISATIIGIIIISIPEKLKLKLEKWVFLAIAVAVGYGITAYTGKIAVGQVGNATYIVILAFTQVFAVLVGKFFTKEKIPKLKIKHFIYPFIGITLFNIGNITYYVALEQGFASVIVPLSNTYVVVTVILSMIILKEKIRLSQIAGIILVIAGVVLINLKANLPPERWNSSAPDPSCTNQVCVSLTSKDLSTEKAKVSFIYDGDTIQLSDGRKIRYLGIDTPERGTNKIKGECFGQEATDINRKLIAGQTVEMAKDISEKDKYGRLLRYIWIDNVFINEFLLRQGFARLDIIPPDTKYLKEFKDAEKEAREQKRGLWGRCKNNF